MQTQANLSFTKANNFLSLWVLTEFYQEDYQWPEPSETSKPNSLSLVVILEPLLQLPKLGHLSYQKTMTSLFLAVKLYVI